MIFNYVFHASKNNFLFLYFRLIVEVIWKELFTLEVGPFNLENTPIFMKGKMRLYMPVI